MIKMGGLTKEKDISNKLEAIKEILGLEGQEIDIATQITDLLKANGEGTYEKILKLQDQQQLIIRQKLEIMNTFKLTDEIIRAYLDAIKLAMLERIKSKPGK